MSDFKAPYLPNAQVWQRVEEFRSEHEYAQNIPVDILDLAELDLGLELIPYSGLKSELGDIEAILTVDMKSIYVDKLIFEDPRYLNRLRFSVAHELGHYDLHRDIYAEQKFTSVDEWKEWISSIPEDQYSWIESQAYEYAGRLLVQRDRLISELDECKNKVEGKLDLKNPDMQDPFIDYACRPISKVFGVSADVIRRRINREKAFQELFPN